MADKKTAKVDVVEELPVLITISRVKDFTKEVGDDVRCSGDFMEALNVTVAQLLKEAIKRCHANNRGTLRPSDL